MNQPEADRPDRRELKWRTLLALAAMVVAVVLDWNWPWGVLFLSWCVPSFWTGQVYLVEEIDRDRNPVLFWIVLVTWTLLSLSLIVMDAWSAFA